MTYLVDVTREGDAWLADVPSVPGAHTFARSLEGLSKSVREVIVLMDDLPDDADVELKFQFKVEDPLIAEAQHLREDREAFSRKEIELVTQTSQLAKTLILSYSVRDTASMLGVTPGRVSQLTSTAEKT